ncbi:MAG TPA: VOC family protein [bacterium]|nr:VOC family protein [bacterium]HOL35528.1 VOC family protein [bacterium]HPO52803.1 VOC family protein [bacterium]
MDEKMVKGIRHTGIVIRDIKKMCHFYQNILGMEKVFETTEQGNYIDNVIGRSNVKLHIIKLIAQDKSMIELIEYEGLKNKARRKNLWEQGITHIALTVDDINKIYTKLKKYGISFVSEPLVSSDNYAKVCFCTDPEGNFLELVELIKK